MQKSTFNIYTRNKDRCLHRRMMDVDEFLASCLVCGKVINKYPETADKPVDLDEEMREVRGDGENDCA